MDIGFFKDLAREGLVSVPCKDETVYIKIPTILNPDIIELMSDEDITNDDKMCKSLALTMCDKDGKLTFDVSNADDLQTIRDIPTKYQVNFILALQGAMFPSKKK